ncbi:hypothetical protein SEA_PUPPER_35 [Gordonia phage Pupper]|uniref:Uncharacterized protein n=1 Tax=Gordonia phage Pupper TaxID=2571249 RepID=A0A4Y6EJ70_9CAUD|nr:hypothetical protein KHQ83_gp035 [Gordonia phage Pupper]QDF18522.1 hypothetical protein SEA_PUPPER_35 [Gordonia phage Pupper]QDF18755.1 hypothetical protein SEA_SCENTAE_35 [Gordonia phage SCentae]
MSDTDDVEQYREDFFSLIHQECPHCGRQIPILAGLDMNEETTGQSSHAGHCQRNPRSNSNDSVGLFQQLPSSWGTHR